VNQSATVTHRVHLGYEVGSGHPVEIPLAHTFVTGQTQLSGKTTALRAIVERSRRRALAFVTKRGETFEGRRIAPYLPREGDRPIPWRLVETILASALGQRNMKYERLWIVNAAKGARSLADVRANVTRLQAKAKGATADVYMLIGEYLDLVLPEMRELAAADVLDLENSAAGRDRGRAAARAADREPAGARDRAPDRAAAASVPADASRGWTSVGQLAEAANGGGDALYQQLLARLVDDATKDPLLLKVLTQRPELQVHVQRQVIEVDGEGLRGRVARLMAEGFFEREAQTTGSVLGELSRRGFSTAPPNVSKELGELTRMGFLTRDNKWYRGVPEMKVNIIEG
jgi:hypothetical protein